ncbi:MAG: hypothetical protein ABIP65_01955 [Vicinamibacterales bacterium]
MARGVERGLAPPLRICPDQRRRVYGAVHGPERDALKTWGFDTASLNQVELWFGKIERGLLERRIFTSVPDLARKIRRYVTRYNENPKPIRWTYRNPAHRITTDSAVTGLRSYAGTHDSQFT